MLQRGSRETSVLLFISCHRGLLSENGKVKDEINVPIALSENGMVQKDVLGSEWAVFKCFLLSASEQMDSLAAMNHC